MNEISQTLNFEYQLIKELNKSSKVNFSIIEKTLGITRKTLLSLFKKVKKKKMINNFSININPNIQPNLKYVFLEIKTNPKEPQIVDELLKIPQLLMLDGIFGEYSLMALFVFKTSKEYYDVLNNLDRIMSSSHFKKYQLLETIKTFKVNGIELSDKLIISSLQLDEIDYLILKILAEEQGYKLLSTYEIKNILKNKYKIEISQPTVSIRIKALRSNNIILNYAINFNPRKIGFTGKFIMKIKPIDTSKYDELARILEKKKEITHLFRIGEEYGLLTIIRVREIEDYKYFITNLYESEEIQDTYTKFVLDEHIAFTNFLIF
ncbi:MAG: Lrp/AsnC family transcriptional regulator [Candidatus Thorarchaeota archaeon]